MAGSGLAMGIVLGGVFDGLVFDDVGGGIAFGVAFDAHRRHRDAAWDDGGDA